MQLYHSKGKEIDSSLRRRLSTIFKRQLESLNYGISDDSRILKNTGEFRIIKNIDGALFHDIFEIVHNYLPNGELVDLHDNYNDCTCYLSDDGLSGFAITKNGDLISVFNLNDKRGWLRSIANEIKSKAKTLDCYISPIQNLQEMYESKFGFKTASIMDYNMDFDHDNIAANHDNPQVAFMVNTDENVITKHFNKDQYDEAQSYQLSYAKKDSSKSTIDVVPEGHKPSLVKDSANLRKEKVYSLKTTEEIIKNVLTNIRKKFPDGLKIKLSSSQNSIIRKTFEEINLSSDVDNVISNLMETILNANVEIGDDDNIVAYKLSDIASDEIRSDLKKAISGLIEHKGNQSTIAKLTDKYLTTIDRLCDKISELRSRTEYLIDSIKRIDSIKKKVENSKSMTATGDMVVQDITMIKNLIKGIHLSKTKKGISPLSVTHFVENLKSYTPDMFDDSLLGFNSDFKAIADYFEDKFVDGQFPNRELTIEETRMFNKGLTFINAMARELSSEKTKQMVEMIKTVHKQTTFIQKNIGPTKYGFIEGIADTAIGAPSYFSGILGQDHEFTKLITTEYMTAYNNKIGVYTSFLDLVYKKIAKQVGIDINKLRRNLGKKISFKGQKISLENALDMYCTLKANEEAFDVGFEIYNKKTKSNVTIKISKDEFDDFSSLIPEKVKQYADEISKAAYNGEFKEYLSKKYEQFTGVPLELTSNYYPQSRGKLNNSGLESLNANDRGFLTTSNTSIIKKRTGSKSPFKVTGFLSRLNGYISKVSYYGEFTEYIDKYRIFLIKKIDGVSINNIFDEIIPNWNTGKTPWSKYLSQIILEKPNGNVDGFFNSLFSKGASAVLGANISSALKQFGSEFTMAMYSGLGDWSKTLFRGLTNLTKWNEISKILQEQQPYFSERWGSAEVIRSKSGASKVPDWIKKFGILMEINDKSIIISHGWALAQYLAKKNGFGDYWSEGNNKEAARILTDIVLTTQSNSQPMYTSRLRSGYLGSLAKNLFGIFGSDNQIKTEQFKKAFYQGK